MPMSFRKSSPETIARFEGALPASPLVEPKKMFGYPAAFVGGNFFAGLHEENVVMRLPERLRDKLPDMAKATGFDPMGNGKGMKDWFVVPPSVAGSAKRLSTLLETALPLVSALPSKKKIAKRSAKR